MIGLLCDLFVCTNELNVTCKLGDDITRLQQSWSYIQICIIDIIIVYSFLFVLDV